MKRHFCLLLLLCSGALLQAQDAVTVLDGFYLGRRAVYIQAGLTGKDTCCCVTSVTVNGRAVDSTCDFHSGAFAIPLDSSKFRIGDSLHIRMTHKAGCHPRMLYENYDPRPTFRVTSHWFTTDSVKHTTVLHWKTTGEIGKLTFDVQQFRWNKWVKIGEVTGQGRPDSCTYDFTIPDVHSGVNQFRVKQTGTGSSYSISNTMVYNSGIRKQADYWPIHVTDTLHFSRTTMYEVYDQSGNIVMKGSGAEIDCSKLKRGSYFLNYDNKTGEFSRIAPKP